jgi:hypothetical protein
MSARQTRKKMKFVTVRNSGSRFLRPPFTQPLDMVTKFPIRFLIGSTFKKTFDRQMSAASTPRQKRRADLLFERNLRLCMILDQYDQRVPVKSLLNRPRTRAITYYEMRRYNRLFKYFIHDIHRLKPSKDKSMEFYRQIALRGIDVAIQRRRRVINSFSALDHLMMIAQYRCLGSLGYQNRQLILMPSGFPKIPGKNATYAERRKYREDKKAYRKKHAVSYQAFDQMVKKIEDTLRNERFFRREFNGKWHTGSKLKVKFSVKKEGRYDRWQQLLKAME